MRRPPVAGLALLVGLGMGCASNAASGTAASGATATAPVGDAPPTFDQAGAELKEHHRHHSHGGITQFVAMSLDTLGADDAKRPQIEKLQGDLHTCLAPARDIEKVLLMTISDGVMAGTIDTTKVDSNIALLATAAATAHDCSMGTLNQLHAILSPVERAALVDKVQSHWEVWRQVNHDSEVGGREAGGRLADLAAELSLTPDQIAKLSTALHAAFAKRPDKFERQKAEAHLQAFATAFVGEAFDAKSIAMNENGHLVTQGSVRMARFYETAVPLLTAEQRTKLAEHLREHVTQQPTLSAK